MKYVLWRYRSALMALAMVGGALIFTATVVNVLDRMMQPKARPVATEPYVPPTANPGSPPTMPQRPPNTAGRSLSSAPPAAVAR